MKTKLALAVTQRAALLLLATLNPQLSTAFAQSTAFTYQGQLQHGGSAANGLYEMSFALYDAVTNGNVVGVPVTVAPVPVTNGLFTVALDFGAASFMGADRWLEISVTVFGSDQPVTTLVPRQPLTPTPYALHAYNAANLMSFVNAPLDIKVNGERALRLEPTVSPAFGDGQGAPNVIGGSKDNYVVAGVIGATIGGGGATQWYDGGYVNVVIEHFGTVSGGLGNTSSGIAATVSGGYLNLSSGTEATVGGGQNNISSGRASTIGGGLLNRAGGDLATVGGGQENQIFSLAAHATIAGGLRNRIETNSYQSFIGGGSENVIQSGVTGASLLGGVANSVGAGLGAIGGGIGNRIEFEAISATIGGGNGNTISVDADAATIGGGNANLIQIDCAFSVISGGEENQIGMDSLWATISGGKGNTIAQSASRATIGGGAENTIQPDATSATIAGGSLNSIREGAFSATIGGGGENVINDGSGWSTISGGDGNEIRAGVPGGVIGGGIQHIIREGASFSIIGGGLVNIIGEGAVQSTISGGEQNRIGINATNATIAGGFGNTSSGTFATIGGGGDNVASGFGAVVAGGGGIHFSDGNEPRGNTASGEWSTVGGGADNVASGVFSVIGGGEFNRASGNYGTVAGGLDCLAAGQLSFAAGWAAHALHDGSFVWSGYGLPLGGPHFESTTNNQFSARAAGGVRFFTDFAATTGAELAPGSGTWSSLSDRHAKENFAPANPREILAKVAALPMSSWNYKAQDKCVRHLGPMAQDFRDAFGLGESDRTITTVDADGVALAAIQGLNQKVEEQRAELKVREAEIRELKNCNSSLETRLKILEQFLSIQRKCDVSR